MAVIGIKYLEPKPDTYESVNVYHFDEDGKGIDKVFDSGDFVKDWFNAIKYWVMETGDQHISHSSSVNHFIMDGAEFDSAYVCFKDDKPVIDYDQDCAFDSNCVEHFVKEGEKPDWDTYKEYCNG